MPDETPITTPSLAHHELRIKVRATLGSLERGLVQLAALGVPSYARVEILAPQNIFASARLRAWWTTPIIEDDDA